MDIYGGESKLIFNCSEVISDHLWVGSYVRPEDVKQLVQLGITTVVCLQSDEDLSAYGISEAKLCEAYRKVSIELRRIPVPDFDKEALAASLPRCVGVLEAALAPGEARVYLHCTAGINRSPTAAAAFLIRSLGLSARQAYEHVVARHHSSPYVDVLERYAKEFRKNVNRRPIKRLGKHTTI